MLRVFIFRAGRVLNMGQYFPVIVDTPLTED